MKPFQSILAAFAFSLLGSISFGQEPIPVPDEPSAPEAPPAALAPKIVCAEPQFDFGERENSEFVEHAYVIRNDGNLSLEILSVRATCGCTAVKPDDQIVPPGGQTQIQAKLDLRGRMGMQIKTITVQSNDPLTPVLNLQLRGTAVQGLRAQPSTLFLGRIGPDGPRSRTFEVVSGKGPISIVNIRSDAPGILLKTLDPQPGDDGSVHRFELTLDASIPPGTLNSQIIVVANQNGNKELSIPVAAFIEAPPAAAPAP